MDRSPHQSGRNRVEGKEEDEEVVCVARRSVCDICVHKRQLFDCAGQTLSGVQPIWCST